MTTALYRRYRPESFAEVIGQEHVTGPLMQALRTGRINHAYLFSGPRGCGKTTSARILARCLNCEQGPTATPCGTCDSCVALARGGPGTVDVIEIDAASHGGVDDARDLRERASYGPAQSRFKIYIIDEAHMVTPQGFNALLKIVEEPPEHVKFVFATTEPEKVIGTIRSRTHHYPFRLVPPAQLSDYLQHLCDEEGVRVAPGVLGFVVRAGGGSVRDSLSVLDQLIAGSGEEGLTYDGAAALLGFTDGELLDATVEAFAARDGAAVFTQVDRVIESGHDPRRFVEDLLERLRDLIVVAAVAEGAGAVLRGLPEDQLDRMRSQAARFGAAALTRAADIVNTGLTEMTGATAPRLQLELICARILLPAASGEQGYGARLDRLERRLDLGGAPSSATAAPASGLPSAPPEPRRTPAPAPPDPSRDEHRDEHRDEAPPPERAQPVRPEPERREPERREPERREPERGPDPVTAPTAAASPRETGVQVEAAPSAPPAGGLDVAAIRRVWPDVLARIFRMSRVTWTFVSQNAQVQDYDGRRLVLGITTQGLANTFRSGKHPEVVRQALIDEIGLDVPVEGIPSTDVPPSSPPPDDEPGRPGGGPGAGPAGGGPTASPGSSASSASSASSVPSASSGSSASSGPASPAPASADWGQASTGPAPDWASGAPSGTTAATPPARPHREPEVAAPPMVPAADHAARAAGVREELARARQTAADRQERAAGETAVDDAPYVPAADDEASPDDEDFAPSGAVGREVVERVLGGKVLGEFEDH
ncbi:DNA polymerase III subunit gamma and tau [Lapillicoccus jejuensis]|uniref:DNA polymerase III subunit gamma/tau n=1 Tax=Lapillicoccus jejuensis TaxID=402171 RepID=A0A542DY05_9MICO|nr:DNA polymerase III subunit gamma and tau [Lapillicoccus jejuensis]TQJ07973.1 DNA polymerase-3 subunit gamma/tau [Lapillicoccus jejuensis]